MIVLKADAFAHVVRKATPKPFKRGEGGTPKRSMRKMTRDLKIDPKSMRTIVKTDLKLSPLKLKKRKHLTVIKSERELRELVFF